MRKLLFVILLLPAAVSFGQSYSNNPYSNWGLGEEGSLGEAQFSSLGNVRSAVIDSTVANFYNPSSYSFLAKGMPLLSVNIAGRISRLSQNDVTSRSAMGNISHIAMIFPITKRFGFAGGVTPFSRKGYSITSTGYEYGDSIFYAYRGVGTTQRAFLGASYQLIHSDRYTLALGANLGYIFGTVSNERYAKFASNDGAGLDENITRMKSFNYDFGVSYRMQLDEDKRQYLTIGATMTPEQKLKAELDYALYYTTGIQFTRDSIVDTLVSSSGQSGTINYPSSFSIGFGYTFKPNNTDNHLKYVYQIGVYAEYSRTSWSKYKENFEVNHAAPIYNDASRLSFGVTYRPSSNFATKTGNPFLTRIQYRAGFYTQTLPIVTSNGQLKENAISFGFGIPIPQMWNSSLNFSIAGGTRNNGSDVGISEKFLNMSVGIVLSPSKDDRWFRKYKLD